MTLNDIIVSALAQLDRGHDSQTMDTWRDRFKGFANDAILDLARAVGLRRSDTLMVENGEVNIDSLPRGCEKVLEIRQSGSPVAFYKGSATGKVAVAADGEVVMEYRAMPKMLSSPTDVPELPEYVHPLIATYVVARERSSQDPSSQRGANIYFEMYQLGKDRLRKMRGEPLNIVNRW